QCSRPSTSRRSSGRRSSWYKYIGYLPPTVDRATFKAALKERGVSLAGGVYDLPLHRQPVFEALGVKTDLPRADDVCRRHVCLPEIGIAHVRTPGTRS